MISHLPADWPTQLWRFRIPTVEGCPPDALRRYWYLAPIVVLLVAALYIGLIVHLDNTNLGTTNGLSKSDAVHAWEHGYGGVDSGGILYFPVYGRLAGLIPDRWLQYGAGIPTVTFRKMAVLNAIFGALASGLVFLLALRFTNSAVMAGIVTLAHAGAAFILLNSINSEDIIPAYAFFLGATFCFFEGLHAGKAWLLGMAAVSLAFTTLFHWTMMGPALAAFGAVFLNLTRRSRAYFLVGAAWLAAFLVAAQALVLLFLPTRHIPIWVLVLPQKANAGGWVGLHADKFLYFVIGVGNYFTGGQNLSDYRVAFHDVSVVRWLVASWGYCLLGLAVCAFTLAARRASLSAKSLALYGLCVFGAGEAGNGISQPQDPQMQIQPMLGALVGLVLLLSWCFGRLPKAAPFAAVGLAAAFLVNDYYNIQRYEQCCRGGDGLALAGLNELNRLFPPANTLIVSHGFEGWVTWREIISFAHDPNRGHDTNIHLASAFTNHRGISGRDGAEIMRRQIDAALAGGRRVVACSLWTTTQAEFVGSLGTVAGQARARAFDDALRDAYSLGQRWQTRSGVFVQLLPRNATPPAPAP